MAENGKILAKIMKQLEKNIKPGITTKQLNGLAQSLILSASAKASADKASVIKCSFKDYNNFPACLCASVNQEIVHGVPSNRILKNGDIISLDLGLFRNGFHADMAITVPVGEIDPEAKRLIRITKKVLKLAIKKTRPGNTFGDIGNLIQRYVESQGFNVIRDLCGHGIGKQLHEQPQVLNYGKRNKGEIIKPGMVFCLEPMTTIGDYKIKKSGHAFTTKDGSLSAHFEHTVVVTENGCEILTLHL